MPKKGPLMRRILGVLISILFLAAPATAAKPPRPPVDVLTMGVKTGGQTLILCRRHAHASAPLLHAKCHRKSAVVDPMSCTRYSGGHLGSCYGHFIVTTVIYKESCETHVTFVSRWFKRQRQWVTAVDDAEILFCGITSDPPPKG